MLKKAFDPLKWMFLFFFFLLMVPAMVMITDRQILLQRILCPASELQGTPVSQRLILYPEFRKKVQEIDETVVQEPFIPKFNKQENPGSRSVYIYNTHPSEAYSDKSTTYEIGMELAELLRERGMNAVFQTGDFLKEAKDEGLKYKQLYEISRRHINDAFAEYGSFDLTIDLHRDSAPRKASVVEVDGTVYARMMFVVGMKSCNAAHIKERCQRLTDKINAVIPGIMRPVFERQSVYNQDMDKNMILLEMGTDQNSTEEIRRSLHILADVLSGGDIE